MYTHEKERKEKTRLFFLMKNKKIEKDATYDGGLLATGMVRDGSRNQEKDKRKKKN